MLWNQELNPGLTCKVYSTLRREERSILISTAAFWATFQIRRQTHRGLVCAWVCLVSGWRMVSIRFWRVSWETDALWTHYKWYTDKLIVSVLAMLWQMCVLWKNVFSSKWSELWEDGENWCEMSKLILPSVSLALKVGFIIYGVYVYGIFFSFSRKNTGGGQRWTH